MKFNFSIMKTAAFLTTVSGLVAAKEVSGKEPSVRFWHRHDGVQDIARAIAATGRMSGGGGGSRTLQDGSAGNGTISQDDDEGVDGDDYDWDALFDEVYEDSGGIMGIMFGKDTVQCFDDTELLTTQEYKDASEAKDAYVADAVRKHNLNRAALVVVDPPDDLVNDYVEACTEAGMNITDMGDLYFSCIVGRVPWHLDLKNQLTCQADSEACASVDQIQLILDVYAMGGMDCTYGKSTTLGFSGGVNRSNKNIVLLLLVSAVSIMWYVF